MAMKRLFNIKKPVGWRSGGAPYGKGRIFGRNNGDDLFPSPIFIAPLTTSLIPTSFVVDQSYTFTRATTSTHVQPDGHIVETLSGEARFSGARRVHNLATALTTHSITVVSGSAYQVTIKGNSGATAVCSNAFTGTLTANGTNRISWDSGTPKTASTTTLTVTVTGTLTELQVEDVTARTNQLPAEWADFSAAHGANVNAVKYLPTANGNTVDANGIVTEGIGAALTLNGLLMEPARTNIALHSEDLSNTAWVATNVTKDSTSVVAPDGLANTNVRLTASAGNGTVLQTVTSASADRSYAVYMKRVTGTGNIDLTTDGGTTWTTKTLTSAWQRFDVQKSAVTNPQFGVRIVTSGDAIDFWGSQEEIGTYPSSYIATSGAAATRNADSLTYPIANFTPCDANGALYLEFTNYVNVGGGLISTRNTQVGEAYWNPLNGFMSFDRTTIIFNRNVLTPGNHKGAVSWETGGDQVLCIDGDIDLTYGTSPYDGSRNSTSDVVIVKTVGGAEPINIGNIRFWDTPLSDAQKQSITS